MCFAKLTRVLLRVLILVPIAFVYQSRPQYDSKYEQFRPDHVCFAKAGPSSVQQYYSRILIVLSRSSVAIALQFSYESMYTYVRLLKKFTLLRPSCHFALAFILQCTTLTENTIAACSLVSPLNGHYIYDQSVFVYLVYHSAIKYEVCTLPVQYSSHVLLL